MAYAGSTLVDSQGKSCEDFKNEVKNKLVYHTAATELGNESPLISETEPEILSSRQGLVRRLLAVPVPGTAVHVKYQVTFFVCS